MAITALQFMELGLRLIDKSYERRRDIPLASRIEQFRHAYGSHPLVNAKVYHDVGPDVKNFDQEPPSFLFSFNTSKHYAANFFATIKH